MATDNLVPVVRPATMSVAELVAYAKKELDADNEERQAKLQAASVGDLPKESQTGATLDLSRKGISALPVEVIELIKDRVERLALSHNVSVTLPSQIVQCDRIRYLNVRWNELDHFPEVILRLTKLEILDLSKNNIEVIPDGIRNMASLKFLAVARNSIRRLPLALGDMPSLQKLKFDENPIEFPPLDIIKYPKKSGSSSYEADREKEACRAVKAYLKEAAAKQRLKTADEESSESNVETPRPPKRTATIGRFPIRPSISGPPNGFDLKNGSPSDYPPPIPQRSHARVTSSTSINSLTPPTPKRPGITPLRMNGNDIVRSRSETAASASLRQRRQGYVPKRGERKVTGELNPLAEAPTEPSERLSRATTLNSSHTRGNSSISTVSSCLASSSGETSSSSDSPVDTAMSDSILPRTRTRIQPVAPTDSLGSFMKAVKRLAISLKQLQRPVEEVWTCLESYPGADPNLRSIINAANKGVMHIEDAVRQVSNGSWRPSTKIILHYSEHALQAYGAVAAALRRNIENAVRLPDGIHIRSLMLQIFSTTIEARNTCTFLGFKIKERSSQRDTLRASRAWSSRTVTPTQPKAPYERRTRRPTVLQHTSSTSTSRPMAPPPMPLHMNGSSSNTMRSMSAATPSSGETFPPLGPGRPHVSRSNTMRSIMGVEEPDDQFETIFLKLRTACDQASQALLACRTEFISRRDHAASMSQPRPAHHWQAALNKCEIATNHNRTLKKRLEMVKVNDPSVRYQRDFWQLCDAFVHSWIDLATEIKDLGSQRVDVTSVKLIMRNVQRLVKDVSKTISHSHLYHHALGTKLPEPSLSSAHSSLAAPFPAGLNTSFPSNTQPFPSATSSTGTSGGQSPYVTSGLATPLSVAIGPAAAHTVARDPTANVPVVREYFGEPLTSTRSVHERNDTVMQPPPSRQGRRPM